MNIAVDLHIHSALSPCGDNDMTPNNIINMALLKGLDAIAVTDHNSAENVEAVMELGHKKGIVVVPGMEVQSKEEVHLLCYFAGLDRVLDFQRRVYNNLEGENNPDYFGEQLIMDEMDRVIGHNRRLLIGSADLSVEKIVDLVVQEEGRVVPAHVDKKAYSIISNLGFIPPDLDIKSIEVSRPGNIAGLLHQYGQLKGYRIIHSSDAHRLEDIQEREFFMEVGEKSVSGILAHL
jgi:PHP family Zn ribbon phosphoesterase